jgi:SPP1 family predicted phage head-tail adaptor
MAIRAGQLDTLVTIEEPTEGAADELGETVDTWSTVGKEWAEITTLAGQELYYAAQVNPEATVQVLMYYRADLQPYWRIKHGSRELYIVALVPDVRLTEVKCYCREQL